VGDTVTVKVIGNDKHKISLSMKALAAAPEEQEDSTSASRDEVAHYKENGKATTKLGDLLKGLNLQ
jgi:predicted RNA-binding protein with RPS1 domain